MSLSSTRARKTVSEVVQTIPQGIHLVDVPVPQNLEERVEVLPQERISERIGDQIVDCASASNFGRNCEGGEVVSA